MNDYSYIIDIEVPEYPIPFIPVTSLRDYQQLVELLFDTIPDGKTLIFKKGGTLIIEVDAE